MRIHILLLALVMFGLMGCSEQKTGIQLIRISQSTDTIGPNGPKSWGYAENLTSAVLILFFPAWLPSDSSQIISLPAYDRDLIRIFLDDQDRELCFEYRKEYGTDLALEFEGPFTRLNGVLLSLDMHELLESGIDAGMLSESDIRDLRYVDFRSIDLTDSANTFIDRVAAINPSVGVIAEGTEAIRVLEKFDPHFLYVETNPNYTKGLPERIKEEPRITSLIVYGFSTGQLNLMSGLPKLTRLDAFDISHDSLSDGFIIPRTLEALTLRMEETFPIKFDPSAEKVAPALRSLSLFCLDTLLELPPAAEMKNLRVLDLAITDCMRSGPGLILPGLESVCFPLTISKDVFEAFIDRHPQLKLVSIAECENIVDIAPLKSLEELEYLIVSPKVAGLDANSFTGLEHLDFLSLHFNYKQELDTMLLADLGAVLPNTTIGISTGLCLGSGYLLIAIPLALVFILLGMAWRRRQHQLRL